MLASILGSAAKTAARAAMARNKAREDFLRREGYRCPACGSDQPPVFAASREPLTMKMWLRGGLLGWLFRKVSQSTLACPQCHKEPDLSPWLAGTEFASR